MKQSAVRYAGRAFDCIRAVKIKFNTFGYAPGSVLFEMGRTKVLCAVSMQPGVPKFLKGKQRGWLSAEYAMLPTSTSHRTPREISKMRRDGRSQEISRLISRSLRTIVDFTLLGERTILVDCDVLQADAGTRTACITGASLALRAAVQKWIENGVLKQNILTDSLAALSVGWLGDGPLLDLDFSEDSKVDADFNIVMTKSGKLIEFQGAVEGAPLSWQQFEQVRALAVRGIEQLFARCDELVAATSKDRQGKKQSRSGLFSLQNRINSPS